MKNKIENLIIDSHAHLNFKAFNHDVKDIIKKNFINNVWVINVGSNYETSLRALEISKKYEKGVYTSIGLHPIHAVKEFTKGDDDEDGEIVENFFDYNRYKELISIDSMKKIVAIGETGLDYYYKPKNKLKLKEFKERQRDVFLQHAKLSCEFKLPLILHCRMAHNDLVDILKEVNSDKEIENNGLNGVVHCYTGDWVEAQRYLEMGLYLGFTGIIFKLDLKEVIEKTPLDKILIETDCPYLTPPEAKNISERNEPIFVKYVALEIARIKKISIDEIIKKTTENARKLFKI
jgi:TatD DNase family protein